MGNEMGSANLKLLWKWFDDVRNGWAFAGLLVGGYVIALAAVSNRWLLAGWPRPSLVMAVTGIVMAVGFLLRKAWAKWFGLAWLALAITVEVTNGALLGWSLSRFFIIALMAAGTVLYYLQVFRLPTGDRAQTDDSSGDDKPFLSLVLLVREHRFLDATILASLISKAWNIEVSAGSDDGAAASDAESTSGDSDDPPAFVVGDSPVFMVGHPLGMFLVHNHDRTYFDEPNEVAESLGELRVKKAVLEHQAWISVDLLHWYAEGDPTSTAYRMIARVVAELADDNVLAVLDTNSQRVFAYGPETERKLRSDDPVAELRRPFYAPVITVDSEDPAMEAAVAEARKRWPEFVAAFEHRPADDEAPFLVKAPFGEGDAVEFIWVKVTGIENDMIYGTLGNEPVDVPSLQEGDRVTVHTADVNDWLCVKNEQPVGGFTIQVLNDRAKAHRPG